MTNGPGKLKLQTTTPLVRSSSQLPGSSSQSSSFLLNGASHQPSNTFPRRGFQMEKNPLYDVSAGQSSPSQNGGLDFLGRSGSSFNSSPQMSPSSMSGLSSPSFITSKTPARSFDQVDKAAAASDVEKSLDLLAAPEANGSLKELVNSFVSTDRAKQAARQTISNTINNMTKRNGGLRSGSPSSSSSPFSSRAVSPLRSPMLAAGASASATTNQGLASLTNLGANLPSSSSSSMRPLSPTGSSTSSNASSTESSVFGGSKYRTVSTPTSIPIVVNQNVHTKMPSIFSNNSSSSSSKQTSKPLSMQTREPITIPVQHVGSELRSPSVLSTIKAPAKSIPSDLSEAADASLNPITSMHFAHVDQMKKRFEEAKQRMNLIHERAMLGSPTFDRPEDLFESGPNGLANGNNDPTANTSYLFDQFRRRIAAKNKPAAPPHPELTPQQRQHIFERNTPSGSLVGNSQQPLRRIMSGGSVAERVMIFERCPPVFANADLLWDGRPFGSGRFLPGVALNDKKQKEPPFILHQPGPVPPWRGLEASEGSNTQVGQSSGLIL